METLNPISSDIINHYTTLCESIPLYPLHNEQDYDKAVIILNALLDLSITHKSKKANKINSVAIWQHR